MSFRRMAFFTGILASIFLIIGCEGDQGPAGPEGTATCVECHSDDTRIVAIAGQWANSTHATGGNFERNSSSCSRCHTSEGFVAYLDTGEGGSPENPSAIGCFTCHEPHTNYNFDLRTTDPVELMLGGTFDQGDGNLCANCHQGRTPSPEIPESGTITITSTRFGVHHGPQANILMGSGAYVFTGASYGSSHGPNVSNGCPTCHMASPYGVQAGGHTWDLIYLYHGGDTDLVEGCNISECHNGNVDDFEHGDVQADIQALLLTLSDILINDVGIMNDGEQSIEGDWPVAAAGAFLNYKMILEDRSLGIHNPAYVEDVLDASIAAVGP